MDDQVQIRVAVSLSIAAGLFACLQSAAGLFLAGVYRDAPFIVAAMRGNDAVTLLVVLPLLAGSIWLTVRSSLQGKLLWTGCLAYLVYNYLYYLYGLAFNRFFLVYAGAFTTALYAFIYALSGLNAQIRLAYFAAKMPVRLIAVFLAVISGILGSAELSQVVLYLLRDELPASIVQFGNPHAPALIFAADLTLVVPAFLLAAIWIWQRRKWGYLLGAIMLVKAFTYGLALIGMVLFARYTLQSWDSLFPFYVFIAAGGLVLLTIFLKNVAPAHVKPPD